MMWFEIPEAHLETPEARRLLELDADFSEVCAQQHEAVNTKLYDRDPDAYAALTQRSDELCQALREALEAYDAATGEPQPVALTPEMMAQIEREYPPAEQQDVASALSKTLGYLRRQGVDDDRVPAHILMLSQGEKDQFDHYVAHAREDFRNIIYWAEEPDEARLDTPEKIQDYQETLAWLGLEPEPELEALRQELEKQGRTSRAQARKPWWRFWSNK